MSNRIIIKEVDPEAYILMAAFEEYLSKINLTPIQKELIKIRASQINGCSFCINLHTQSARKLGETEQRIYALTAWRETPFFSEHERAILALTEEVTLIQHHVSDETYTKAASLFDQQSLAQLIMAIVAINAWNRIAISTNMMPALI